MRKAIAACFLLFCGLAAAYGQYADVSSAGGPATIDAAWRFHTGDDPAWASPTFDDSQWQLIRIDKTWAEQGYKGYYGFAWYRIKVKFPAGKAPLMLAFREVCYANEIYADGQLIGTIGVDRSKLVYRAYSYLTHEFALPASLHGKTVELAIRVWEPKLASTDYAIVGETDNPSIGTPQSISLLLEVSLDREVVTQLPLWIVDFVGACIAVFSFWLFLTRPRSTEYLWAAVMLLCPAAWDVLDWLYRIFQLSNASFHIEGTAIITVELVCWLLFTWRFVRIPLDRLFFTAAGAALLVLAVTAITSAGFLDLGQSLVLLSILDLVLGVLVFARLVRMAVKGNRDAQLLLVPFVLQAWMQAVAAILSAAYRLRIIHHSISFVLYHGSGFDISWFRVFDLLSYASVGAVLVLRFARTAERHERLSAEMEAAHRVQEQLVPAQLPAAPGFRLEAAYAAAGEVGGDFYQVFPQADGSLLAAIGDVSGKGLKAAMLGTLVVGALRSLAQEGLHPAQILARLNAQLVASADGGFITCCVAHITSSGSLALANAGHLAPYRNGAELAVDSGFPLGVISGVEYAETSFSLAPGDRLTFLSDGVVEARNPHGELFGFERTASLSTEPAQAIARAASTYGQEDDITVLTLTLAPTLTPAEALHA